MPVRKPDNVQVHRIELGKKERKWVEDFVLPQQLGKAVINGTIVVVVGGAVTMVSYAGYLALKKAYELKGDIDNLFAAGDMIAEQDIGGQVRSFSSPIGGVKLATVIGWLRKIF